MSRPATSLAFSTSTHLRLVLVGVAFCLGSLRGASGLRGLQIKVPEAVRRGSSVELACDYDLEGALLYSIKWYKDDQEFFSFVPKEAPPTRVFSVPGIFVDEHRSGNKSVVLRDVQRELTAYYKCEVSGDQPTFHTEVKSALMLVVDMPQETPQIDGVKLRYNLDEAIEANCTSALSFPASNITWFVNEMPINSRRSWIKEESVSGLETAISEMRLSRPVFMEGRLTLKCVATLYNLYRRVAEFTVKLNDQEVSPWPPASVRHSDTQAYGKGSTIKGQAAWLALLSVLWANVR